MLYDKLTKENINKMVIRFYSTVIKDDIVGPFFIQKLGDKMSNYLWKTHLELLTNFWSSIALGDRTYNGNPFAPHLQLKGLQRETFEQWLKLFYETQDKTFTPEIADFFKQRSTIIAGNFMRNLNLR